MFKLESISQPVDNTLLECLGSGYVKNTHFIVYKGKYTHQLYFRDNSKPLTQGWYALCEAEKESKDPDWERERRS
jgi:hypothetical protein